MREKSVSFSDRMPTFLTKSDETILKSIKIDQEILMRKKSVVRLHLLLSPGNVWSNGFRRLKSWPKSNVTGLSIL